MIQATLARRTAGTGSADSRLNSGAGMLAALMGRSQAERVLRQHVQTDGLLGAEVLPCAAAKVDLAKPQAVLKIDRATRIQLLEQLDRDEVRGCTKCELCHSRTPRRGSCSSVKARARTRTSRAGRSSVVPASC